LVYTVDINKNNVSTVYRADEDVTTWLSQDLLSVDTVIHLHDVSRIVNGSDTFGIIKINNEKIRYSSVDLQNNTLSGLTRGILGTSTSDLHNKFDIAYSLNSNTVLDSKYYNVNWNTKNINSVQGDPLQLSTSTMVTFLKYGHY